MIQIYYQNFLYKIHDTRMKENAEELCETAPPENLHRRVNIIVPKQIINFEKRFDGAG